MLGNQRGQSEGEWLRCGALVCGSRSTYINNNCGTVPWPKSLGHNHKKTVGNLALTPLILAPLILARTLTLSLMGKTVRKQAVQA